MKLMNDKTYEEQFRTETNLVRTFENSKALIAEAKVPSGFLEIL